METPKYLTLLGGRKMFLTLIAMFIGGAVEMYSANGMSASFAGLLAALIAAFSASNTLITNKQVAAPSELMSDAGTNLSELEASVMLQRSDLEQSKAETAQNFQQAANAVQELANTIANMKKVLTAVATGKK